MNDMSVGRKADEEARLANRILDLWDQAFEAKDIALRLNTYKAKVTDVVARARIAGDPRAHSRHGQRWQETIPEPECAPNSLGVDTQTIEVAVKDAVKAWDCHKPVSVPALKFDRRADPLRPIRMSIERELSYGGPVDLAPLLLGDPSPERSALGRPVQPHETARRGQGTFRDSRRFKRPMTATEMSIKAARFIRWREERRGKEG